MAVGDIKSNIVTVDADKTFDIRPPVEEEWIVKNIYYSGKIEIYFTDGTNSIKFDSSREAGAYIDFTFGVTNSYWLQIKNLETSSILIGFDAIQIK